jgi:hypothetical protein
MAVAVVGTLAGSACGEDPTCDAPSQKYPLPRAFEEHACTHIVAGPFETVAATTASEVAPPELRNTHVAYTVELARPDGSPPGQVMFKPRDTGPFAFFVDSEVPLALRGPGAQPECPVAAHPVTACAGLRWAVFFELERKLEYHLGWDASAPGAIRVVVEPLIPTEQAP